MPRFAKSLRTWGEAAVIKIKKKGVSKVQPVGTPCMFVGYSMNHATDVWRFWNPATNRIMTSRDVSWQHRMFFPPTTPGIRELHGPFPSLEVREGGDSGDDDDANMNTTSVPSKNPSENATPAPVDENTDNDDAQDETRDANEQPMSITTRSGRQVRAPDRLVANHKWADVGLNNMANNMGLTQPEKDYYAALLLAADKELVPYEVANIGLDMIAEIAAVGAGVGGGFKNTSELKVMK